MDRYYYIAPQIFPIFPEKSGETIVGINFQSLLRDAAYDLPDADLDLTIEAFMQGGKLNEENLKLKLRDGLVSPHFLNRTYTLPQCGYVVISLKSEVPYFRRLKPELGYGMLARPGGGFTTIISQPKYAVPLIIDNMRETGTFCLVHPAQYMDRTKNSGNSVFFINPYEGKIVTRITTASGREIKQRLEPCSAMLVSLGPLLDDRKAECVMYTGNNRMIGWDVRHRLDAPEVIYNIDHLEYFRAYPTLEPRSPKDHMKKAIRRTLRNTGLWF